MEMGRGSYNENRDCDLLRSSGGVNRMRKNMDIDETSSADLSSISLFSGVGYIEHPVSKFDTLAGIAIKYGVEVITHSEIVYCSLIRWFSFSFVSCLIKKVYSTT